MTMSKKETFAFLEEYHKEIPSGQSSFAEVASRVTDYNTAKREGHTGSFGRGKVKKSYDEAPFALKVGEINQIEEINQGLHIILRTE